MIHALPAQDRFHQLIEAAPVAMVLVDAAGYIELVNAAAARLFGHAREQMVGHPVALLIPDRFKPDHPGHRSVFQACPRARPMGAGRDLYALRADGGEIPVEIALTPIETGQGLQVLASIVDISERRRKEEQLRAALREKETLLSEVHHRVKNNLQIVYSLLALQSARISDPAAIELLRASQSEIRSMALIHQTIYGSKDFDGLDLGAFLGTLVPVLTDAHGVAGRLAVRIDADPVRLPINGAVPCGLLVNELINNALRHAYPSGGRGEVRVGVALSPDERVTLSVTDDGVGLPDHVDPAGATTFGLQLVSLLAGQLGGEIAVHRARPTRIEVKFRLTP